MTKALISVEGLEGVYLLRLNDGGSEVFEKFLNRFNTQYENSRKNDPFFKMAQLIRSTIMIDKDPIFGWAVYNHKRVQHDYEYILKSNGSVTQKKVDFNIDIIQDNV